jgi:hypothetical protein
MTKKKKVAVTRRWRKEQALRDAADVLYRQAQQIPTTMKNEREQRNRLADDFLKRIELLS